MHPDFRVSSITPEQRVAARKGPIRLGEKRYISYRQTTDGVVSGVWVQARTSPVYFLVAAHVPVAWLIVRRLKSGSPNQISSVTSKIN